EDRIVGIVPGGQIVLHFINALRDDDGSDRVFLSVDHALLQRGKSLGPLHLLWVRAQSVHDVYVHRPGDAHLQTPQIVRRADRADTVGDFTEAVLSPRENDDVPLGKESLDLLGGSALGRRVHFLIG